MWDFKLKVIHFVSVIHNVFLFLDDCCFEIIQSYKYRYLKSLEHFYFGMVH